MKQEFLKEACKVAGLKRSQETKGGFFIWRLPDGGILHPESPLIYGYVADLLVAQNSIEYELELQSLEHKRAKWFCTAQRLGERHHVSPLADSANDSIIAACMMALGRWDESKAREALA